MPRRRKPGRGNHRGHDAAGGDRGRQGRAAQAAEPRQGLPDRARRRLGRPAGKKAHEIVVSIDVQPSEVHKALEQLGLKPGKPALGGPPREGAPFPKADGPIVNVYLEVPDAAGGMKKVAIEKVLIDPATKKGPPKMTFIFTGSAMTAPDPNKPIEKKYGADLTGSLICLFPVTDEVVLQTTWTMKEEKYLKFDVNNAVLPKEGGAVKLVIEVPAKK